MPEESTTLTAYETEPNPDCRIVPAGAERKWMEQTHLRYAYRCLPLVIANQAGWFITTCDAVRARWNGGHMPEDMEVHVDGETPSERVSSHFGCGVLTFRLPYLFRTPPGVNLWVKGPSNRIKDGIQPLEGVVETDWSVASFTMNWRFTRPDVEVCFERDEPFCMIVPLPRGFAESLTPRQMELAADPEIEAGYREWKQPRKDFLKMLHHPERNDESFPWQKHYYQGRTVSGLSAPEHQMRLDLKPFKRATS